jgi:mono/diheme cytochrome c family protein
MRFPFRLTIRLLVAVAILVAALSIRADDKSAGTYRQKCAACHGPDGKAQTPAGKNLGVRSFGDPAVAKTTDAELSTVIEKGKGKMPSYGKTINGEDVKAMVAYVRSLAK